MSAINVNSITGRTGGHGPVLTGVTTVSDGNLVVIGAGASIGIGTSAPAEYLNIFAPLGTDAAVQLQTTRLDVDKARISKEETGELKISSSLGSAGRAIVFETKGSGQTERMRIRANGEVGIGTDSTSEILTVAGNVRVQNSSDATQYLTINYQGIDFQNTGAGSSTTATSHLLDDFEEGTWTPTLTSTIPGTGSFSASANNGGFYTKIGKRIFFTFNLQGTWTNGTASGNAAIKGIPFANASQTDRPGNSTYAPVPIPYNDGFDYGSGYILAGGLVTPGTTQIRLYAQNNTDTSTTSIGNAATDINLHGGGSYEVP